MQVGSFSQRSRGSPCRNELRTKLPKANSLQPGEVDLFAVYAGEIDRCFLLPGDMCAGRTGVYLRLAPAANNQSVGVHWADDFQFHGAVAQLARALAWHARGRRFESAQLHLDSPRDSATNGEETVRADVLRPRLGEYLQRSKRGETFTVTRRGTPIATLGPYQPPLPDPDAA